MVRPKLVSLELISSTEFEDNNQENELDGVLSRVSASQILVALKDHHEASLDGPLRERDLAAFRRSLDIALYYHESGKTMNDIATELNLSQSRVSELIQKCLYRLRRSHVKINDLSPEEEVTLLYR